MTSQNKIFGGTIQLPHLLLCLVFIGAQMISTTTRMLSKYPSWAKVPKRSKVDRNGACQKDVYLHQKCHPLPRPGAPRGPDTASWRRRQSAGDGRCAATTVPTATVRRGNFLSEGCRSPQGRQLPHLPSESSFIHMNRLPEPFQACIPGGVILTPPSLPPPQKKELLLEGGCRSGWV